MTGGRFVITSLAVILGGQLMAVWLALTYTKGWPELVAIAMAVFAAATAWCLSIPLVGVIADGPSYLKRYHRPTGRGTVKRVREILVVLAVYLLIMGTAAGLGILVSVLG